MTFGEHLEELRSCLFKALMGLLVGFVIGLYFADSVVLAIQVPLQKALIEFYKDKATEQVQARFGDQYATELTAIMNREDLIPDPVYLSAAAIDGSAAQIDELDSAAAAFYRIAASDITDAQALAERLSSAEDPVSKHINQLLSENGRDAVKNIAESSEASNDATHELVRELNRLLGVENLYVEGTFLDGSFSDELQGLVQNRAELSPGRGRQLLNWSLLHAAYPDFIGAPRVNLTPTIIWRKAMDDERVQPQSLGVQEPFMIFIKAALLTGAVLASPWIFYQIWSFVAAGLYPHEKKYIHLYLPFSIVLFLAGAALAYFFVFEPVLGFLFKFNKGLGINPDPKIGEWLGFFLMLPVGFGISFQLPLVMLFMQRIGIFDVRAYLEKWRIAVLVIFVLSAILTPADPYSMMLMAVPLTFLYFGGIALCRWLPGGRNPYATE